MLALAIIALSFTAAVAFLVYVLTRHTTSDASAYRFVVGSDSPEHATIVSNIVTRWYRDKSCAYCERRIGDVDASVIPALRSVDGAVREWRDVDPGRLPALLAESLAVCPRCERAERFHRDFPRLGTYATLQQRAVY